MTIQEMDSGEFNHYYKRYIDLLGTDALVDALKSGAPVTKAFFSAIPEEKQHFRYEEGKWTPKEVLSHLIDTERVFSYRALQFARSNSPEIRGYDQDEFVDHCHANSRTMKDLIAEYEAVRNATIAQFESYDTTTMAKLGVASGYPLSARAAGFIIAGHEKHHAAIIEERYL